MRWIKWTGIAAAVLLIVISFLPWVTLASRNISVSGIDATGTNFGKPAYFHFLFVALFIVLTLISSVMAKRLNLLVTALNLAWAVRNYFIITLCRGGECPEKQVSIYLVVVCSVLMLVSAMFPDMKLPENDRTSRRQESDRIVT